VAGRLGLHHLDLVVSSLERSLPLYRELLGPLGYTDAAKIAGERGEEVWYLWGEAFTQLGLREAQVAGEGGHDRYAVGVHHVAFTAPSRDAVDERLAWAREQGLEIENEPQEWPYMPGYYAGFFHDPDGIKLEIVHVPERSA
jgi:catechol 2,3-dioxygenase-like lactoylglutathione lyase family enzyme